MWTKVFFWISVVGILIIIYSNLQLHRSAREEVAFESSKAHTDADLDEAKSRATAHAFVRVEGQYAFVHLIALTCLAVWSLLLANEKKKSSPRKLFSLFVLLAVTVSGTYLYTSIDVYTDELGEALKPGLHNQIVASKVAGVLMGLIGGGLFFERCKSFVMKD